MPWQWVPPDRHLELEVFSTRPTLDKPFYECYWCRGWIEGEPMQENVDTIAPLSGRRGTVSYCRRCGKEIGFFGMMS